MLNVKRFPGVLYRYKAPLALVCLLVALSCVAIHWWGLVCTNREVQREIDRLCKLYKKGEAIGNLCVPLCVDSQIHSVSCISRHSKKQLVFTAKWNKRPIIVKSSVTDSQPVQSSEIRGQFKLRRISSDPRPKIDPVDSIEADFEREIRKMVVDRVNMTLTNAQLDELKFLEVKNKFLYSEDSRQRKVERENVFSLLQSHEYLLSRLFSDRDIFPQVMGTCGHLYAVELLQRPSFNSMFTLDEKAEWSERMKLAVSIMDFVEEVETNFPDALHLCDVQMNHLGVAPSGRVKFLDLDMVYMKNILDRILQSGQHCNEHKDCDLLDCKSTCNLKKNICDAGVANDNLQAICEKIFIGWTMSGKMIVPGLLMSEYTPASLSALLRLCAENGRQPVHEDLRQKLYTTLTEMHQILIQKILAE